MLFPGARQRQDARRLCGRVSYFLHVFAGIPLCLFLFFSQPCAGQAADAAASSLAAKIDGLRFSATRAYNRQIEAAKAEEVARTAAHNEAMNALVRYLVQVPEARVAAGAPGGAANLLTLAHAAGKTAVLFVGHSRKESTVTVTVVVTEKDAVPSLESRLHDALIHPERLALYEETRLREETLVKRYDALFPTRARADHALVRLSEAAVAQISQTAGELRALTLFKEYIPSWNGAWDDPDAIRAAMQNLLPQAPHSALIHNALGNAWLQLGRSQEAMEAQNTAIKYSPAFAAAYHARGVAAMTLGLFSSAAADISEAIRLSPQVAGFYRDRGLVAHLRGDFSAMCADFHEACALGDCQKLHWADAERLCVPK